MCERDFQGDEFNCSGFFYVFRASAYRCWRSFDQVLNVLFKEAKVKKNKLEVEEKFG